MPILFSASIPDSFERIICPRSSRLSAEFCSGAWIGIEKIKSACGHNRSRAFFSSALAVLVCRNADVLFEQSVKVILISNSDDSGNLVGGKRRRLQQLLCPVHPQLGDVLGQGVIRILLEAAAEVVFADGKVIREILDGQIPGIVVVDIVNDVLDLPWHGLLGVPVGVTCGDDG